MKVREMPWCAERWFGEFVEPPIDRIIVYSDGVTSIVLIDEELAERVMERLGDAECYRRDGRRIICQADEYDAGVERAVMVTISICQEYTEKHIALQRRADSLANFITWELRKAGFQRMDAKSD